GLLLSLVSSAHRRFSSEPDMAWITAFYPSQVLAHALGIMRLRERAPAQVYDLRYEDLMADPLRALQGAYDWLGVPFTAEAESRSPPGWRRTRRASSAGTTTTWSGSD